MVTYILFYITGVLIVAASGLWVWAGANTVAYICMTGGGFIVGMATAGIIQERGKVKRDG